MFEFFSHLDLTTGFLLVIIFILFMLSFKKVLGLLKNALIIIVASVLFPIAANKFLGLSIPMDGQTIFSFIFLGISVYFLYILGSAVYKGLSYFERGVKPRLPESGKKEKRADAKEEPDHAAARKDTAKPYVVRSGRKRKNWEKDFLNMEESQKEVHVRKKHHKATRKKKKASMEKIRVIGEED